VVVLALAWLVDVPNHPLMVLGVLALLLLVSFAVTAFGLLVAVSIKQAQTFTSVSQMFTMPLIFLSGALYPVAGLAAWLAILTKIDPLTYAVDPMRRLVFAHLDVSESARQTLAPGVSWWGWHLPPVFEATMVLVLGAALLGAAVWRFSRTE
jgi:ABC-2 type transport system permease protein